MIDVSIIYVNYNTVRLLSDSIKSLIEKSVGVSYEIIVVDNNSSDDAEIILNETFGDKVQFIQSGSNLGFGRANNIGIEKSLGRNVLFLNPDTLLVNDAITILSNYLDENTNVGAVGANLYTKYMEPAFSYKLSRSLLFDELDILFRWWLSRIFLGRNSTHNFSGSPLDVYFISGADLMMPRRVLSSIGGFDSSFFMYYEDTELCSRVWKNKLKVVNVPTASIIHLEGQTPVYKEVTERFGLESRKYYLVKCHNRLSHVLADFVYVLGMRIKLFVFRFFGEKNDYIITTNRLKMFKSINNC